MDDPRYPIGRFVRPDALSDSSRAQAIDEVAAFPFGLGSALAGLNTEQLDTPYRDGGWTVRQLVHHVADSHLNAYIRFKLGVTEEEPAIIAYRQDAWANTADARLPLDASLKMIEGVHERWSVLMLSMAPGHWSRRILHPESGPMRLDQLLALYAWHGRHHRTHITRLRERMGW